MEISHFPGPWLRLPVADYVTLSQAEGALKRDLMRVRFKSWCRRWTAAGKVQPGIWGEAFNWEHILTNPIPRPFQTPKIMPQAALGILRRIQTKLTNMAQPVAQLCVNSANRLDSLSCTAIRSLTFGNKDPISAKAV